MNNDRPKAHYFNYELIPGKRGLLAFLHDISVAVLAWLLAYSFRFNFEIPVDFSGSMLQAIIWVVPIQACMFLSFGLYRGMWRFASIPDLKRILKAITIASLFIATLLFMLRLSPVIPRSVLIMDPILLLTMMGGSRFAYRAWKEHKLYSLTQMQGEPVLVLGASDVAMSLLRELSRSSEWRVVGLLDEDTTISGRELMGTKVLGGIEDLPQIAKNLGVTHTIVAMASSAHKQRRRAVEISNLAGLKVLTVPAFEDLMSGKINISDVRPIEVEDLLGRDPVNLDNDGLHELFDGRVIMITGAGGSIGSELSRQISKYQPSLLVCLDISEYSLYMLEQEFSAKQAKTNTVFVTADIRNEKRLKLLMQRYKPSIVFHAAAYKHVPLMEKENVSEGLVNNVRGTYVLAKTCKDYGVEKFVLISTDKAVNPTNVMGASKRLAEMVCQGLQEETGTHFVIVRFGNVLGSSGSVIPKFREQIAKGGPVTVTHPEITRYFMSIPEAAQLVMQAGLMGTGAQILVLDMGEPVRIIDLARDMIRLSGLSEEEISIEFTGLRPGEKLYEELLADDEMTLPTPHEKLRIAIARTADNGWVLSLLKWIETTYGLNETDIKQQLKLWVQEYTGDLHSEAPGSHGASPSASSTIH